MNIWIVNQSAIPPSMGGLVRHYYFSKYLQAKGYKVRIITSSMIHNSDINMIKDNSLYKVETVDDIEYTFVRVRNYSGNGLDRILSMLEFPLRLLKLQKLLMKNGDIPDVIYASSPSPFAAVAANRIANKSNAKNVFEVRDLWPESIVVYNKISRKNPIISLMYQMEKSLYKNADKIVFTMRAGKRYITEKGWNKLIPDEKIFHLNNGVDIEEFQYNKVNFQLDDPDLDNTDTFKVIYMGSVRKVNNLISLVKAAEVLQTQGYDDIKVLVYGDGTERNELEELCRNLKLENIIFKGRIEKKYIASVLSKADLNVIHVKYTEISKYGCSWNKLFEYLASRKPILSNCPVAEDLIEQYNCGISKLMEKPEEYASEILKFYHMNKEEYQTICRNAEKLSKEYDYKKLSNELEEILLK